MVIANVCDSSFSWIFPNFRFGFHSLHVLLPFLFCFSAYIFQVLWYNFHIPVAILSNCAVPHRSRIATDALQIVFRSNVKYSCVSPTCACVWNHLNSNSNGYNNVDISFFFFMFSRSEFQINFTTIRWKFALFYIYIDEFIMVN